MGQQPENPLPEKKNLGPGVFIGLIAGAIAVGGFVLILGCAGVFVFWSYSAVEAQPPIQPVGQAQHDLTPAEKRRRDESIPGIVDNLDRRMDQFDELGAPVDREKNEKLKSILGDLTGADVE